MQLGLGVTSGMEIEQIETLSNLAQRMGIQSIWVGDDITGSHDVFTVAGLLLLKYEGVSVGIGITSPLVRNITTIGRASAVLAEIGNDRFRLGLGIGGLQDLKKLDINVQDPVTVLRQASKLLRRIWEGEKLSLEAERFKLDHYRFSHNPRCKPPIFFGVRGPRMLALAGEIADGLILSGPKTYLRKVVGMVRGGMQRKKESAKDFTFAMWIPTIVTKKPSDLNLVKRTAAFILLDTPRSVLEMAEIDLKRVRIIKEAYRCHGIARAAKLVSAALVEEVAIHGEASRICEDFRAFDKIHVQEVVFGPPYGAKPRVALAEIAQAWRDSL